MQNCSTNLASLKLGMLHSIDGFENWPPVKTMAPKKKKKAVPVVKIEKGRVEERKVGLNSTVKMGLMMLPILTFYF